MTGRPIETGSHAVVRRLGELENHSPSFTLYVDHRTSIYTAYQIGSRSRPFKTIQQALDTVQPAIDEDTARVMWTIFVAPGTYDEDLIWDLTDRRIRLVGTGPVNIGVFNGNTWAPSGTRRNITFTGTPGVPYGNLRSYAGIVMLTDNGNRFGAVSSSFSAFRLSGKISVTATTTGFDSFELDLEAEVFGTDGGPTGVSFENPGNARFTAVLTRTYFRGQVDGNTQGNFSYCDRTRFRSSVKSRSMSLWNSCVLEDGLHLYENPSTSTTVVKGLLNSSFEGLFDGTEATPTMYVNKYTDNNMTANSATLGVGAVVTVLDA